jgi:ABC-2 type transport system ATP-binding protein
VQLQTSALPNLIRIDEAMSLVCGYQHRAYRKDLLKKFDLEGLAKRKYYSLSTGQKRRLNLALALVSDPQVVILDEPTAGLDVEARINLHSIIRELKSNGITILLATHDMAEAEELCDKITILINGKSAVTGTPSEITSASCTKSKVKIRTRDGSLLNDNNCVQGYAEFLTDDAANLVIQLLTKVTVCNDTVEDLRIERPSLEERFIEIIKGGKTA